MSYIYSFEKLHVWNDARKLVKEIYFITEQFPQSEKFSLTNQMRRASISIVSNIAEGTGRTSAKDQAYFFQIAYSSLIELLNQIIISKDLNFLKEENLIALRTEIEMISNKINSLRNECLKKITTNK